MGGLRFLKRVDDGGCQPNPTHKKAGIAARLLQQHLER